MKKGKEIGKGILVTLRAEDKASAWEEAKIEQRVKGDRDRETSMERVNYRKKEREREKKRRRDKAERRGVQERIPAAQTKNNTENFTTSGCKMFTWLTYILSPTPHQLKDLRVRQY